MESKGVAVTPVTFHCIGMLGIERLDEPAVEHAIKTADVIVAVNSAFEEIDPSYEDADLDIIYGGDQLFDLVLDPKSLGRPVNILTFKIDYGTDEPIKLCDWISDLKDLDM